MRPPGGALSTPCGRLLALPRGPGLSVRALSALACAPAHPRPSTHRSHRLHWVPPPTRAGRSPACGLACRTGLVTRVTARKLQMKEKRAGLLSHTRLPSGSWPHRPCDCGSSNAAERRRVRCAALRAALLRPLDSDDRLASSRVTRRTGRGTPTRVVCHRRTFRQSNHSLGWDRLEYGKLTDEDRGTPWIAASRCFFSRITSVPGFQRQETPPPAETQPTEDPPEPLLSQCFS